MEAGFKHIEERQERTDEQMRRTDGGLTASGPKPSAAPPTDADRKEFSPTANLKPAA